MVAGTFVTVTTGLIFFHKWTSRQSPLPVEDIIKEAKLIEAENAPTETEDDDCGSELLDFIAIQKLMKEYDIKEI